MVQPIYNTNNNTKSNAINIMRANQELDKFIISQQELQIDEFRNMTNDLKKEIKQANVKTFLYKVGTVVGVLTTSYLLLDR
mgnify:CR=1 FL=1